MEALIADMLLESARNLEQAMMVLNPDQRKQARALFKESTFPRAMSMRQALEW